MSSLSSYFIPKILQYSKLSLNYKLRGWLKFESVPQDKVTIGKFVGEWYERRALLVLKNNCQSTISDNWSIKLKKNMFLNGEQLCQSPPGDGNKQH